MKGKEGVSTAVLMALRWFGNDGGILQLNLAYFCYARCLFRDELCYVTDTLKHTLYYK